MKITAFLVPLSVSILFFCAYATMSLKMYSAHQTRGDLTAYAQGMWNTLHGNFMASTYNYSVHNYYDKVPREITEKNSNIFGIHFNPVLLFFLPVYAIFADPSTLLILQSFLVAAGGLVMYVLAKKVLKQNLLALTIQGAYLTYFATVSAALNQFHGYTLALFFGPLLLVASRSKKSWFYYLSLILFLMVQENTSLVATFFGAYLLLKPETRKRGVTTLALSISYFILVIYYVIPSLSPYNYYLFSSIYGSPLGGNIQQIMVNTLRNPLLFVESVFTPPNLIYMKNMLLAIIPFALLSPALLLVGFSSLAQNLLSSSLGLKTQQMHYESGSVAFLFYALILGMSVFLTKTKLGKTRYGGAVCLIILAATTFLSYKQLTANRLNPSMLSHNLYTQNDAEMDALIKEIPAKSSVSTQDYLSAHLSARPGLYQFPVYTYQAEYLLLTMGEAVWPLTAAEHSQWLQEIKASKKYQIKSETEHFVLFEQVPHPSQ
jgi:uncharacterized membrane protein